MERSGNLVLQINNWMQFASVLELPVNIIYKDATCINVIIQNTCLNLEEEFLNLKLPIGLQETILIYVAAEQLTILAHHPRVDRFSCQHQSRGGSLTWREHILIVVIRSHET